MASFLAPNCHAGAPSATKGAERGKCWMLVALCLMPRPPGACAALTEFSILSTSRGSRCIASPRQQEGAAGNDSQHDHLQIRKKIKEKKKSYQNSEGKAIYSLHSGTRKSVPGGLRFLTSERSTVDTQTNANITTLAVREASGVSPPLSRTDENIERVETY
ncbi:hypothetical protein E2C01_076089 [Portunus trituberculatus]|uniref:Uncharacterized protein n=1 Tax=Portunus trituberculatus TaxID=210409 RepID=A0A5B7ICB7_PORTR|nr:hypothetical protein [Portunus trituberculatus]